MPGDSLDMRPVLHELLFPTGMPVSQLDDAMCVPNLPAGSGCDICLRQPPMFRGYKRVGVAMLAWRFMLMRLVPLVGPLWAPNLFVLNRRLISCRFPDLTEVFYDSLCGNPTPLPRWNIRCGWQCRASEIPTRHVVTNHQT